jgi:zinc protease
MMELVDLPSAEAAGGIVAESGWGGHTPTQLGKLLTGKVASMTPFFNERSHGLSGSATAADLPTALDLAVLVMTSPNRDPAAFDRVMARTRAALANRATDPGARYSDRLVAINTMDDPRQRPMTVDRLGEIDLDRALGFYRRCFLNPADFAFFLVGNVNVDSVRVELERTIGSIPAMTFPIPATAWVARDERFPKQTVRETVHAGREPRATTTLTFASYDGHDPFEWHRIRTACSILERRLRDRLREDRGATYGVGVGFLFDLVGPSHGRLVVRYGSAPGDAASLGEDVLRAIRELQESGPTAEELAKEKELQRRELETSLQQNGFWQANLEGLWMRGMPLTDVLDRGPRIDALDLAELHRVFREDIRLDRMTWVDWLPEAGSPPAGGS